jgi:hypothetical protein
MTPIPEFMPKVKAHEDRHVWQWGEQGPLKEFFTPQGALNWLKANVTPTNNAGAMSTALGIKMVMFHTQEANAASTAYSSVQRENDAHAVSNLIPPPYFKRQ